MKLDHHAAERLIIATFNQRRYQKTAQVFAVELPEDAEIETREGWLKARKGDYLVCNVSPGVSYPWPVKKEIFEATYKLVM